MENEILQQSIMGGALRHGPHLEFCTYCLGIGIFTTTCICKLINLTKTKGVLKYIFAIPTSFYFTTLSLYIFNISETHLSQETKSYINTGTSPPLNLILIE